MGQFLPFYLPPKNQNFEKLKIIVGDIIILHMCTKNHSHMRYVSWKTKWVKQDFNFISDQNIF